MLQSDSASQLDLQLLGPPQVVRDGRPVTAFRSSKSQAILYFLAVTGSLQRRSKLAALFWPESDDQQASTSLRSALSNLRALVGDHLEVTRQTALLHGDALSVDVTQFEALLKSSGDKETDQMQLEAAVSLYRGEFLEGFHVPDAPEFEQWATIERERSHQAVLNALLTLTGWHADQEDFAAGLEDLTRLLAIDPASEAGHRQKMIALARLGQRSAALQQYEVCRGILAEELGVDPSPETTALHELIRAGALEGQSQSPRTTDRGEGAQLPLRPTPASAMRPRIDQRGMPERTAFHGRQGELTQLNRWLTADGARLVAVSGMGGVGKTMLAVESVARLADGSFDCVIWRSLVNAPPLESVVDAWLQIMAGQHLDSLPESMDEKLSMLFDKVEHQRCLLILDNLESILEPGERSGQFRAGYEEYGHLIDRMGRSRHRSCLLLTTRDLPKGLRGLEEDSPRIRILPLEGLPAEPGIELLRDRGVSAKNAALVTLIERYSGNPLALKLVADTVRDLFGSNVDVFLGDETPVFDDIRDVLDEQVGRLSELGRELVTWLAIERQPVSAQTLWQNLVRPPRRAEFLEAIRSLQNGSLVEVATGYAADAGTQLALQNVVMEYLTDRLVTALNEEIESGQMVSLHRYALVKAQCQEYVQENQRRLLLEPVARQLVDARGRSGAVAHLRELLDHLRQQTAPAASYAAASILHLLLHLEADLGGWNFSHLAVRQADLRTDRLTGVDMHGAELRECAFSGTFGLVKAVAISSDGRYLAAGESDGSVFVWRLAGWQSHLVLKGHRQSVSAVAFTPDGAMLASSGFDGRICLWNIETGGLVAEVLAHADTIGGIAISPDGALIASGGFDRRTVVWDWRSGEIRRGLQETAPVNSVAFSPDGRQLASAKEDHETSIWDWRNGTLLQTLRGQTEAVRAVVFHPRGTLLATAGEDRRICLWPLADPSAVRTLDGHAGWVWALAFSADGQSLASASADGTIRLWDVASGQIRRTLIGHAGWTDTVAYAPDGMKVASGGYDQTIRLWDATNGVALHTFRGYQRRLDLVRFSPDGTLLMSSSLNGPLHLWNVRGRRHLHRLTGHRGAIRMVAISRNNELVAGSSDDHHVYVWDAATGRLKQVLFGHTDLVRHVAFSPDDRFMVSGSYDGTLRIWETATGQIRHIIQGAAARIQSATWFSSDGLLLAYGSGDGTVQVSNVTTGDILERLPLADEMPVVVVYCPQGQLLACGTACGALWVWEVREACTADRTQLRFRVQPAARAIWRIFFSPDGKRLAICYADGASRIIDVATGEDCYSVVNIGGAYNLAFGGAGKYLAVVGDENSIGIRDTGRWEEHRTLSGYLAQVTSLDVGPDGDLLASSHTDGAVRLWSLASDECLATLVPVGPYAGMNITGVTGMTAAQRATLTALGAVED